MNLYLIRCLDIAATAHAGQVRRGGIKEPFIMHPLRVSLMAYGAGLPEYVIAAALLHDVVEDTPWTLDNLRMEAIAPETLHIVQLLTKWWPDSGDSLEENKLNKEQYYTAIKANPFAVYLKLLDRADNLKDMAALLRSNPKNPKWPKNYLKKTDREFPQLEEAIAQGHFAAPVLKIYREALEDLRTAVEAYPWKTQPTQQTPQEPSLSGTK